MDKNCKGCNIHSLYKVVKPDDLQCGFEIESNGAECPCKLCLVKVMCDVDCPDRKELYDGPDI